MRRAPRLSIWIFFSFSVSTSILGCDRSSPDASSSQPPAASVLEEGDFSSLTSECTRLRWLPLDQPSKKEALGVEVTIDEEPLLFQLDTGSDATMFYQRRLVDARGWAVKEDEGDNEWAQLGDFRLGGIHHEDYDVRIADYEPGEAVGTIGLDVLEGHVVMIDYPNERLCVLDDEASRESQFAKTSFVSAQVRDRKFFVNVSLGGKPLEGIFFDTGASLFPLVVDLPLWRELTGLKDGSGATSIREGWAWGEKIRLFGAPTVGALQLGEQEIEAPLVYYREQDPEGFANWPFFAQGLIGNTSFWDGVVVLDLRQPARFGFASSSGDGG